MSDRIEEIRTQQKERMTKASYTDLFVRGAYLSDSEAALTEVLNIAEKMTNYLIVANRTNARRGQRLAEQERLLERLVVPTPWSWSQEGLDDCCMFCGEDNKRDTHKPDCAWVEGKKYLDARSAT